jgi:hypothetical protein
MDMLDFDKLCREASELLELDDTTALGLGYDVWVGDVMFEAMHMDGQNAFVLLADIGSISPQDKVEVYECLLAMQLAAWAEPLVRFGFHPLNDAPVLCVGASFAPHTDAAWLASLLKSMAMQITQWRSEQLAGKVHPRGEHDEFPIPTK